MTDGCLSQNKPKPKLNHHMKDLFQGGALTMFTLLCLFHPKVSFLQNISLCNIFFSHTLPIQLSVFHLIFLFNCPFFHKFSAVLVLLHACVQFLGEVYTYLIDYLCVVSFHIRMKILLSWHYLYCHIERAALFGILLLFDRLKNTHQLAIRSILHGAVVNRVHFRL